MEGRVSIFVRSLFDSDCSLFSTVSIPAASWIKSVLRYLGSFKQIRINSFWRRWILLICDSAARNARQPYSNIGRTYVLYSRIIVLLLTPLTERILNAFRRLILRWIHHSFPLWIRPSTVQDKKASMEKSMMWDRLQLVWSCKTDDSRARWHIDPETTWALENRRDGGTARERASEGRNVAGH